MRERPSTRVSRGFTLIELMTVVAIVAVLATVAVFGVRKYVRSSKTAEAYDIINSIKSGEEAYREETFAYLDVSNGTLATYFPQSDPSQGKVLWNDPDHPAANATLQNNWLVLGVAPAGYVQFRYAAVAGNGVPGTVAGLASTAFQLPTTSAGPWYVVQALGDQDGDGKQSVFLSSSFAPQVYSEHETE